MNILLTMAFDGRAYSGFQVQKNAPTVCETVQNALEAVLGERAPVIGCSRTDSGVHALSYCLNFHAQPNFSLEKMPLALNAHLPADIRVKKAVQVAPNFHARYDACQKEYLYRIYHSGVDTPFGAGYSWRVGGPLSVEEMQKAAALFVGSHDFAGFMSAGSSVKDTVRTVFKAQVEEKGEQVTFTVCADGYLYNMVRILVGTLVEVGAGKMPLQRVHRALEQADRSLAGPTAPAQGLFLARVIYPPEVYI